MNLLLTFFRVRESGSTLGTEVRAGLVTFLTMAYVLVVNPLILSEAGMPAEDVTVATALSAAVGTLLMGLWANYPFAQAPGMGLNAYFTYTVVKGMGVDWRTALGAVFIEGLIFLVLSVGGVRTAILNAIPEPIKLATTTGIGLFLALLGLKNAGLVVPSPATLVQLGNVRSVPVLLALLGVALTGLLASRKVPGALLLGIAALTALSWGLGLSPVPTQLVRLPALPTETLWAFDLGTLLSLKLLPVIFAFLFVDIFDTAGTLLGVGRAAGLLTTTGELPRAGRAFATDAVATMVGAALGTSTVVSYVESAAGVEEGGRTGLTALVVSLLFLLAPFFTPLFTAIPALATAPALVVVGAMMMGASGGMDWRKLDDALPAFLTVALMPFTFSIANGIAAGLVSWALLRLLTGRAREGHPVLYGVSLLLVLHYALG